MPEQNYIPLSDPSAELARRKRKGRCYFCNRAVPDAKETVNGKPDDFKVCPECFQANRSAILGARARIKAFESMF